MKECSTVCSNVVWPSLLGCLRGGRPSVDLLGTKADDDNFDYCASIYFKLSWLSYCANKIQNIVANRTENRVILCWVFFQRWYETSLTSWAPARLGQGGQGQHRLDWRARQNLQHPEWASNRRCSQPQPSYLVHLWPVAGLQFCNQRQFSSPLSVLIYFREKLR